MAGWSLRQKTIRRTYQTLGKNLSRDTIRAVDQSLPPFENQFDLSCALLLSQEALAPMSDRAKELHLILMHNARLKMIRHLLPEAQVILDLGGANAPLHRMGYTHDYDKIVLIDLPTEERHKEFQVEIEDGDGKVFLRYEDMTDLKGIESDSVDLVWSGQSIEHVTPEQGMRMCREAFRVLRPGGHFCLDTPNGLVTKLHAATVGAPFVHPDHKIEYSPDQLRAVLTTAGFTIAQEWGVCEMPFTVKNKSFSYDDFMIGGAVSKNINDCYIQFFDGVKLPQSAPRPLPRMRIPGSRTIRRLLGR